jgi:competence CoiA-like predicted nuclease
MREVIVGKHRADIKLPSGLVVELQYSGIDGETVEDRQEFYKDMVWVFNGQKLFGKMFRNEVTSEAGNDYVRFTYCRPRAMVEYLTSPVYIDYGEKILRVKQDDDGKYSGRPKYHF